MKFVDEERPALQEEQSCCFHLFGVERLVLLGDSLAAEKQHAALNVVEEREVFASLWESSYRCGSRLDDHLDKWLVGGARP